MPGCKTTIEKQVRRGAAPARSPRDPRDPPPRRPAKFSALGAALCPVVFVPGSSSAGLLPPGLGGWGPLHRGW